MSRSSALVVVIALAACGGPSEDVPQAEPGERSVVVHGAGWTPDDSDPSIPWVPRERIAFVARDDAMFHLALESDLVVEVHGLRVGWSQFHDPGRTGGHPTLDDHQHRSLTGVVDRVLLGEHRAPEITLGFFCSTETGDDRDVPCDAMRRLVAHPDERAVLFLQLVEEAGVHYLAGHTADALRTGVGEDVLASILASRRGAADRLRRAPRAPITDVVDREIARMTRSPREQYDAMRALVALGPEALPAIVRHMDDRRVLPSRAIMVENSPGFFEAYAHYSIGAVIDALAVVATRLSTGPWCTQLLHVGEDGTSERARARCAARWTEYVARGLDEGAFGDAWR